MLPAGTRLKHGTAVANLPSILKEGLQAGHSRHLLRSIGEARPKAEAVYVGGPSAYFGAWASSSALLKEYASTEPRFEELVSLDPAALLRASFTEPPLAIPVVLQIELRESTRLVGDEDFAAWIQHPDGKSVRHPTSTDEQIWTTFYSGGLDRAGGIPPDWITSFEVPRLVEIGDQSTDAMEQLSDDCVLLAAGVSQNQDLLPADQVHLARGVWAQDVSLSHVHPFSDATLQKVLSAKAIADSSQRLFNLTTQHALFSWVGKEIFDLKFV